MVSTAFYLGKEKLRHSLGRPSRSDFVHFQFMEKEVAYIFNVSNPYLYVSYVEIQSWFQIDKSSKGKHRGLGLYNVKELCEKYDANIVCRNKLDDSENWVEFTLEIAKTDK